MKDKEKEISNSKYFEYINQSPFIKDRSKTTYINALTSMTVKFNASVHAIIHDPTTFSKKLRQLDSLHTQKTYLTTLLATMNFSNIKYSNKPIYIDWYTQFKEVKWQLLEKAAKNEPTERQKKAYVPWDDILAATKKLPYASKDHMLMCMYTMLPPRRQLDYKKVRIYTSPIDKAVNNHNYIHLAHPSGAYIQLSEYKTSSYMKNWYKKLPDNLLAVIKASLEKKPREYLFVKTNGKPYENLETFTFWTNSVVKRVLKNKYASINTLRHSFENHLEESDIPWNERKKFARDMGHSLSQAYEYQLRFKVNKDDVNNIKLETCYTKDENGKETKVDCVVVPDKQKVTRKGIVIKGKLAELIKKARKQKK